MTYVRVSGFKIFKDRHGKQRCYHRKTGIKIAAAWGTVTASAIMGTAKEPKPAPKPLLLTPKSSTAGTAIR